MSDALIERLCEQTGLDPADVGFLREFSDAELSTLIEVYRRGKDKRERDLAKAIDDGLKVVPFLLRPAVKAALFS